MDWMDGIMLEYKGMPSNLTKMALDDHKIKGYRPVLNRFTKSVIATLILNQAMYWANKSNPFYKFKLPCGHPLYKPGDSWCEEMGLTRAEFDTGLKYLGQKISKKIVPDQEAYIWYWSDMDNKTYYCVNWGKVDRVIAEAYGISNNEQGTMKNEQNYRDRIVPATSNNGKLESSVPESKNQAFLKADMPQSGKTETGSRYKDTNTTQSKPIKTSSSASETVEGCKGGKDDEDFVSNKKVREQLIELGLDESEAKRLQDMWPGYILQAKINDVNRSFANEKVGNLLSYVKTVFGQRKLYTPAETQLIYKRFNDKKKQVTIKLQTEETNATVAAEQREFIEKTDRLIAEITQEQIAEFEKHLQGKKTLLKMYKDFGINGAFVKAELRGWLNGQ